MAQRYSYFLKPCLWIGIVLSLTCTLPAQGQTTHQQSYWVRAFFRVPIGSNWSWQTEFDNRRFFSPSAQLQFIAHTHLHRRWGQHWETSVGLSHSWVWQGSRSLPEWRPFQELYYWHVERERVRLSHRLRTEVRWLFQGAGKNARFRWRFRYMPRLDIRLWRIWALRANTEIMFHDDSFDQWRFYTGMMRRFSKAISAEIGYLKVIQKRGEGQYFDRDNVRATVFFDF